MFSRRDTLFLIAGAAPLLAAPASADDWKTYRNARFGTTIDYPDRFRSGRPPDNGGGLGFSSRDGAKFVVYGSHNVLEHDLAGLEADTMEERDKSERVTYRDRGANWFVISGTRGDDEFYERHLLSHDGKIVNGFVMSYPARLRGAYDPIVTRMSRSFRASRGADTEGNP
ncbi:MAG: hypothetical protein QOI12_2194 [Alphaproteobacteria bacterium]|jgi:hypothetical protein|nr:hypothetical protein [Alphaproteobacteria bacterium]